MGSMVVLSEKDPLLDSQKTLTNSTHSDSESADNQGRTSSISSSVFNDVEPANSVDSYDRLSTSPIIVTPPDTNGTGTPVFISSQPESIDLDNDSDSCDASLINELMMNRSVPDNENQLSTEENGFNIDRTDTVRTLRPIPSTSIPIRGSAANQSSSITDDYSLSPMRSSVPDNGQSISDSADGIMLQVNAEQLSTRLNDHLATEGEEEEQPEEELELIETIEEKTKKFERLHDSTVFSHDCENMTKQSYFLLAGAAVVGLAAVYLKNR